MKLPLKWLKEYVSYTVTHEEFIEKMMWRGFEIAEIFDELPDVEGVVVGRVNMVERHPNADKLSVCTVDAGDGQERIVVCGAPNVYAGMLTPVALPGARLPGDVFITPTEMRGVISEGMLCSGKELGMTDADYPGSEVYGLLDLRDAPAPGTPIAVAVGMDDIVFNVEPTPNRPDCQSIIGICREVAAALNQRFVEPVITEVARTGHAGDYAGVTVENSALCPRYAACVVTDIVIEPSPLWMQKKLRSVGLRPINNIVDITNFVMVEYGHPMHAFDLACVTDGQIVVRNALENETVRTLDGKDRPVDPSMLLIADPKKGVGIAGVMGGENSEIKPETKVALFEAAVFERGNIRATARKLRHTTDAAARFIKGTEAVNAKKALDRAIELVTQLKAGRVVGDTIDVCAVRLGDRQMRASVSHINKIIDTTFTGQQMADILDKINISAVPDGDALTLAVPHYRLDIEDGIETDWDIAEEVARIYGYYNIAPTLMRGGTLRGRITRPFCMEDDIKDALAAAGAYEMYNYNFIGPATLDALLLEDGDERRRAVKIMNPFGEDQGLMRTTLVPGMLKTVALNINRRTGHGRFFEVGNVHIDNNPTLPEERKMIGIICFGAGEDFYSLKGAVEELLESLGVLTIARFVRGGAPWLHPGRRAQIYAGDVCVGEMGEARPDVTAAFDVNARVYVAELSFNALLGLYSRERTYAPAPRYPVVQRDVAVQVDEDTEADALKAVIENAGTGVLVEHVRLFDVFRGGGIPEGKKSLAYSFVLRKDDRTLTDEDITAAMAAIIRALEDKGAILRT
ncbi:MAG: phenylalanine--tRNA ligase subunit beta [Clostridiales bacterium]|jgi:phenylalanyl-tRNA synthetase beta chain|nr:phenylalanine--tRNA ligase subunit beta [Clostridiales bacterium]